MTEVEAEEGGYRDAVREHLDSLCVNFVEREVEVHQRRRTQHAQAEVREAREAVALGSQKAIGGEVQDLR